MTKQMDQSPSNLFLDDLSGKIADLLRQGTKFNFDFFHMCAGHHAECIWILAIRIHLRCGLNLSKWIFPTIKTITRAGSL